VLAFTTDEAWEFVPGAAHPSVHEDEIAPVRAQFSEEEQREWNELFALRERVLPELEKARQAKLIGKSLEAKVTLAGKAMSAPTWRKHKEVLRELLNVSQVFLTTEEISVLDTELSKPDAELIVKVSKADGTKCERCWHWETDIGQHAEHLTICGRCVEAVKQATAVA
jgi:isoleucyl-tRNA synthetase